MTRERPPAATMNDVLFDYALRGDLQKGQEMNWRDVLLEWLKEWSGALIGLAMAGCGIWGLYHPRGDLWRSLSETAVVAGTVTFTVDPFVKKRLIREAGKDIFRHLLGVELPAEVRNALQRHLFDTTSYRENMQITAHAESAGNEVILTITQVGKVVAIKNHSYQQGIAFEESEQGELLETGVSGHRDPSQDYEKKKALGNDLALTPKLDEAMVLEWHGPHISLKRGEKLTSYTKFQVRGTTFDHFTSNFAAPIIQPMVRVSCSHDLEISASIGNRQTGDTYTYDKVFLPGDHIQIRWKPKQQFS